MLSSLTVLICTSKFDGDLQFNKRCKQKESTHNLFLQYILIPKLESTLLAYTRKFFYFNPSSSLRNALLAPSQGRKTRQQDMAAAPCHSADQRLRQGHSLSDENDALLLAQQGSIAIQNNAIDITSHPVSTLSSKDGAPYSVFKYTCLLTPKLF